VIEEGSLLDMTELAYGDKLPGMFPSPGGCDECIHLFLYRRKVSAKELEGYLGKLTGDAISLKVLPLEMLWQEVSDAKALSALHLYHCLRYENKIPSEY